MGEGALGIDDAGEQPRQRQHIAVAQFSQRRCQRIVFEVLEQIGRIHCQPEGLPPARPFEGRNQIGIEQFAGMGAHGVHQLVPCRQDRLVDVADVQMRRLQRVDAIGQEKQVALQRQFRRNAGTLDLLPRRVMPAHHRREAAQWCAFEQIRFAAQAVGLGAAPGQAVGQAPVFQRTRHAAVVQHARIEQKRLPIIVPTEFAGNRFGDPGHPFAVLQLVDADEVENGGQCADCAVGVDLHGRPHQDLAPPAPSTGVSAGLPSA